MFTEAVAYSMLGLTDVEVATSRTPNAMEEVHVYLGLIGQHSGFVNLLAEVKCM